MRQVPRDGQQIPQGKVGAAMTDTPDPPKTPGQAYDEGIACCDAKGRLDDNPFYHGTMEWRGFRSGYLDKLATKMAP